MAKDTASFIKRNINQQARLRHLIILVKQRILAANSKPTILMPAMNDQRHPDIEIYIKNRSLTTIESWLRSLGESCAASLAHDSDKSTHQYSLTIADNSIPVFVHERAAGKAWTSVWFQSEQTPWIKDLDCARIASITLETQVRCIASGWQNGDDPDEWWKIEDQIEELIQWTSA